jgi:DNA replication protein DnaC
MDEIMAWELRRDRIKRRSIALEAEVPSRICDELESPTLDPKLHPGPELRRHLEAGRTMIVLIGPPGTGKTLTAVLALVDRGYGNFLTAPHYAFLIGSFNTSVLAERAADRGMLVVDDLGEEGERDSGKLAELLTHRYNLAGQSTTIVTSNLSLEKIATRYGQRIVSRLEDPRHGAVIPCPTVLRPRRER